MTPPILPEKPLKPTTKGGTMLPNLTKQHNGKAYADVGHTIDHINRGGGPGVTPNRSTGSRDRKPLTPPKGSRNF